MNKPPSFQFYAKDWLSSATVRTMSMHHRGIYITVLAAMWDSDEPGTLPLPLEVAARSAGLDPRSLRDFMAKCPQCLAEVAGKLTNEKLREQWKKLLEFKQSQADAARRTNEKLGRKQSVSESVSDSVSERSAFALASSSAKEGCPLVQLSQDHPDPKLQEPVPTPSSIEKRAGKNAEPIDSSAATNGGQRAHLEAGIYRKEIEAAYFDATRAGRKPDACIREAISAGARSLLANRSVELRGLNEKDLARNGWARIQTGVAALYALKTFEMQSRHIVPVVTHCLTSVALEFWERERAERSAAAHG